LALGILTRYRLGELVMLHRIKMDEESSSDDTGSLISSSGASTAPSSDLEKLNLGSGPSMSSVYSSSTPGDDADDGSRPPSRPGSLFHRRKGSSSTNNSSGTDGSKKKKEREDHMCRWLQAGNVIYKSVGLGLMDLTVGMKVIEFARDKGVGAHVAGF
jgi:hypothetical protein